VSGQQASGDPGEPVEPSRERLEANKIWRPTSARVWAGCKGGPSERGPFKGRKRPEKWWCLS